MMCWTVRMAFIVPLLSQAECNDRKFYVDQPPITWGRTARNLAVLIADFLQDRRGLDFWRYVILIVGFTLSYRDTLFFGAAVTSIITASGMALRLVPKDPNGFTKQITRCSPSNYRTAMVVLFHKRISSILSTRNITCHRQILPTNPSC